LYFSKKIKCFKVFFQSTQILSDLAKHSLFFTRNIFYSQDIKETKKKIKLKKDLISLEQCQQENFS